MKIKMGKLVFRPLPGLSIVTLICLAILFSLGTWQYKRLVWKTNLLTEIERAANAAPLSSLAQVEEILKSGNPLDFHRIELSGEFVRQTVNDGQAFHLMRSDGKRFYWRLYQPYSDGHRLSYIATHGFADTEKSEAPAMLGGEMTVVGYVRIVRPANKFIPKSTPSQNRWFAFNAMPQVMDWAKAVEGAHIQTEFYIDQEIGEDSAKNLPVKMPEIANNHLDYMLTWYSFMIILLVIYFLFHKRAGRLYTKRD